MFPPTLNLNGCRNVVVPKTKVELHNHLDGSIRMGTIFESMIRKGMKVPGDGSLSSFKSEITVSHPFDLKHFLGGFDKFYPVIQGDLELIRRVCLEFCEDKSREGVAYIEPRISPHLMSCPKGQGSSPDTVLKTLLSALKEGEKLFDIKVGPIICCIRGINKPEWSLDVGRMCRDYKSHGLIGIDIVSDEKACLNENGEVVFQPEEIEAYKMAKDHGVHRTAHAGEDGPASSIKKAIEVLEAERIGHGYHVLDDPDIYEFCKSRNIHFEVCPTSSILTGSVDFGTVASFDHPLLKFAEDNLNFSINCDDSLMTDTTLDDEYQLVRTWGLSDAHIVRANFNAARSCFLPDDEKADLIETMKRAYGIVID